MMFKVGFNGYSVKFSPYHEGRLAVATAQNFGIIGNGRWASPPPPSPPVFLPLPPSPARRLPPVRGPLDTASGPAARFVGGEGGR